ncbi:hypothetical protein JOD18_004155 [Gracilibacillus alcaliphilus]|nr:hypothetical protein [Gracilibacillus alcaliphilus]
MIKQSGNLSRSRTCIWCTASTGRDEIRRYRRAEEANMEAKQDSDQKLFEFLNKYSAD